MSTSKQSQIKMWGSAGNYRGVTENGREVEVEYLTTSYGDKGWQAWVGRRQVTDYPRKTRAEALAVAMASVAILDQESN